MSDEIYININPQEININIDENHECDSLTVETASLTHTVNGRFGNVVLDKTDIPGYINWDNSFFSVSTLSANWQECVTYLIRYSGLEAYQGDATIFVMDSSARQIDIFNTIEDLSGNWNTSFYYLTSNSAIQIDVNSKVNKLSANWSAAYAWVYNNAFNSNFYSMKVQSITGNMAFFNTLTANTISLNELIGSGESTVYGFIVDGGII